VREGALEAASTVAKHKLGRPKKAEKQDSVAKKRGQPSKKQHAEERPAKRQSLEASPSDAETFPDDFPSQANLKPISTQVR